ncbi:hypothetical protein VULLAG_LOCUS13858 [Vulpes lagopus]
MTEEVQGKMNYDDQRSKLEDFNSRYKQCQCPHFACKRIEARTGEVIFPRLLTRSELEYNITLGSFPLTPLLLGSIPL